MRVLAIDDNKEITDMLSLYFETQGIEFKAVNDGKQGLQAIHNDAISRSSSMISIDNLFEVFMLP